MRQLHAQFKTDISYRKDRSLTDMEIMGFVGNEKPRVDPRKDVQVKLFFMKVNSHIDMLQQQVFRMLKELHRKDLIVQQYQSQLDIMKEKNLADITDIKMGLHGELRKLELHNYKLQVVSCNLREQFQLISRQIMQQTKLLQSKLASKKLYLLLEAFVLGENQQRKAEIARYQQYFKANKQQIHQVYHDTTSAILCNDQVLQVISVFCRLKDFQLLPVKNRYYVGPVAHRDFISILPLKYQEIKNIIENSPISLKHKFPRLFSFQYLKQQQKQFPACQIINQSQQLVSAMTSARNMKKVDLIQRKQHPQKPSNHKNHAKDACQNQQDQYLSNASLRDDSTLQNDSVFFQKQAHNSSFLAQSQMSFATQNGVRIMSFTQIKMMFAHVTAKQVIETAQMLYDIDPNNMSHIHNEQQLSNRNALIKLKIDRLNNRLSDLQINYYDQLVFEKFDIKSFVENSNNTIEEWLVDAVVSLQKSCLNYNELLVGSEFLNRHIKSYLQKISSKQSNQQQTTNQYVFDFQSFTDNEAKDNARISSLKMKIAQLKQKISEVKAAQHAEVLNFNPQQDFHINVGLQILTKRINTTAMLANIISPLDTELLVKTVIMAIHHYLEQIIPRYLHFQPDDRKKARFYLATVRNNKQAKHQNLQKQQRNQEQQNRWINEETIDCGPYKGKPAMLKQFLSPQRVTQANLKMERLVQFKAAFDPDFYDQFDFDDHAKADAKKRKQ